MEAFLTVSVTGVGHEEDSLESAEELMTVTGRAGSYGEATVELASEYESSTADRDRSSAAA